MTTTDIKFLAELCKESYHLDGFLASGLRYEVIIVDNISFLTFNFENKTYIVFTGSNDKKDWKYNFDFKYTIMPYGRVHNGFLMQFKKIYNAIKNIDYKENIIISGHSLGGALANLVAIHLAFADKNITLVTFGSPRVFHKECLQTLNKLKLKHIRYLLNLDIVGIVPIYPYKHLVRSQKIGKKFLFGHDIDRYIRIFDV